MVDGNTVKVQNDVQIVYDDMIFTNVDGDEVKADLIVTLTSEGVIKDVYVGNDCIATSSIMAQEIVESMCDE
jgi:outer membrane protein assembly factor BamA